MRRTRRPNANLTQADFDQFPLWEYADDEEGVEGQDETWVRPVTRKSVPRGVSSIFVAMDYVLASGRKVSGFAEVETRKGLELLDVYVFSGGQDAFLRCRQGPSSFFDPRRLLLALLGMREEDFFPVRYTVQIPLQGERALRSGVLTELRTGPPDA